MSATMTETTVVPPSTGDMKPVVDTVENAAPAVAQAPVIQPVEEAPGSNTITNVTADLTPEEEFKVQQAWVHIARLMGQDVSDNPAFKATPDLTQTLKPLLTALSPEQFRMQLWTGALPDHPDAAVLRFLRARKWDVQKGMEMLVSAINWRAERRINDDVIRKGESVALADKPSADDMGFINQYRSGKSYVRGKDLEGRPIYVIRVKLHDPRKQSGAAMENYVLHNIECIKTMLTSPNDKALLLFDLTGFGLKNMDYHVVKFLVSVFEARYPETLGLVLVHNAPFVFWGIWSIIKGWLDPVIASKIHFTSKPADMLKFISKDNLQKSYGGDDKWEYKFLEPVPGENKAMEDGEGQKAEEAKREQLLQEFERETMEWVAMEAGSEASKAKLIQRNELARQLRTNFWTLDPHVRARTYYHRSGVVGPKGEVDFKAAK